MKKALFLVLAAFALNTLPIVHAGDALPEIAPVDETVVEPLPDFVPAQ